MTICMAWVGTHPDDREYLWMASDSRTRGAFVLNSSPKLMPLSRSDCAICFAGDTAASYPLMMQVTAAIAAHQPARERSLDINRLKEHLLRICTDIVANIDDAADPIKRRDVQFILGGFSWRRRGFEIYTIEMDSAEREFVARPSKGFHDRLDKAAFIGDRAIDFRRDVIQAISKPGKDHLVNLEPLPVLADVLRGAKNEDSIGGPPQLLQITAHMNTRPYCVRWNDEVTLFGRNLHEYENCDYWIIDPFNLEITRPRKYGHR